MRKLILLSLLTLQFGLLTAQSAGGQGRLSHLFNFGWRSHAGDLEGAYSINYDDSSWRVLDLPYNFQIEQSWDKNAGGARGFKAMGIGWYRKTFKADPEWKGKRVLLGSEGIMLIGDVRADGQKVGGTDYGYTGFEMDIAKLLRYDVDNVVAVNVPTGKKRGSHWYMGGGLFRGVYLLVKDHVSIIHHGVFISTPEITEQSADINVQVEVEGTSGKQLGVEINARIFSLKGESATETEGMAPKKNKLVTVEAPLPVVAVSNPQLWSCEIPNLYKAEIILVRDGRIIDDVTEKFGIRIPEYSPEFGFKPNGKKLFLKGIANHHDLGAVGAAAFDRAIERQFELSKKSGYDHARISRNPYSKSFIELADKHGIPTVDKLIDKWSDKSYWGGRVLFTQLWYKMIPEWIKHDRNHLSVIMWSIGNELQMREDLAEFPTGDWGVTTYRIFDVLVKRYNSTRKTTVAIHPSGADATSRKGADFNKKILLPELPMVAEVASFNYQYTDYAEYLEACPDLIAYQSEATSSELTAPFFGMDRDKMVGLTYWGAIEYRGESSGWLKRGWNYSFSNHTLEPYPQAYLIKSVFSGEPLVHIGVVDSEKESIEQNDVIVGRMSLSSHWNRAEGSKQNLFTYTSADEVELLVNRRSLGIQKNKCDDT